MKQPWLVLFWLNVTKSRVGSAFHQSNKTNTTLTIRGGSKISHFTMLAWRRRRCKSTHGQQLSTSSRVRRRRDVGVTSTCRRHASTPPRPTSVHWGTKSTALETCSPIFCLSETWHGDYDYSASEVTTYNGAIQIYYYYYYYYYVPLRRLRSRGFQVLERARPLLLPSAANSVNYTNHGGVAIAASVRVKLAKLSRTFHPQTFERLSVRVTWCDASCFTDDDVTPTRPRNATVSRRRSADRWAAAVCWWLPARRPRALELSRPSPAAHTRRRVTSSRLSSAGCRSSSSWSRL